VDDEISGHLAQFHSGGTETSVPARRLVLSGGHSGKAGRHQLEHNVRRDVWKTKAELTIDSYFFTSNSGVDGCANKHEPGYEHMEWLRIQLQIMRERGIKAILMGHVPPARVDSKESWDETCWQKYTLWVQQYRDVIVGSLYGHMNIDHFMLQDFEQIDDHTKKGDMASQSRAKALDSEVRLLEDGEVTVASASDYLLSLRDFWARLPSPLADSNRKSRTESEAWNEDEDDEDEDSFWAWLVSTISGSRKHKKIGKNAKKKYLEKIGGRYAQRYSASLVSPSVVPNYYPTLRIVEYNITGLEHLHVYGKPGNDSPDLTDDQQSIVSHEFSDDEGYKREMDALVKRKEKQKEKATKRSKKFRFKVPEGPSKSAPPGPAYSPQTLTWTRYTQYFANLTRINNDFVDPQHHKFDLESQATSTNVLAPRTIFGLQVSADGEIESKGWKEGKHGKHQGKKPRPEPHPIEFEYEIEYDTKDRKFPDLTVRRWVEYARKIGGSGAKAAEAVEYEEEVGEPELDVEDVETEGKKHKKHKKGKKHHKASKEWFVFVKRAFVGTMDPHEIKEVFGSGAPMVEEVQDEVMEL
jgi:endopolyphosphatase